MSGTLHVSNVRVGTADASDIACGVIALLAIVIGDAIVLEGFELHQSRDGRLSILWPAQREVGARHRRCVRPLDDSGRCVLERQVPSLPGVKAEAEATP